MELATWIIALSSFISMVISIIALFKSCKNEKILKNIHIEKRANFSGKFNFNNVGTGIKYEE